MKPNDARQLSPAAQEAIRRLVIQARAAGMTQAEASRTFKVSRSAINNWEKALREAASGEDALASRKRGPKSPQSKLAGTQAAIIANTIRDRDPAQLKLGFMLWTREAVQQLIRERFQLSLSLSTVGRCLKKWGFTPQKPLVRAREQDPVRVERWLREEYPAIASRAKKEGARIYWGDEMGVRSDHHAGRSYAPKGETPILRATGQRVSCNMISAITNRGDVRFKVFKGRFSSSVFLDFLARLCRDSREKIFLVVDGHSAHKSKVVREFVARNAAKLEIFYLPPYSPELNPQEYMNNDVKTRAGKIRRASGGEIESNLRSILHAVQKNPAKVGRYFHANEVSYAAA